MPKNIGEHFLKTMNYVVNLDTVSYNRLYMYLTAARYIQEMPAFVRAMVHLVDEVGIDFFIAFSIASTWCAHNTGHHIINVGRTYSLNGFRGDMNDLKHQSFNQFSIVQSAKLAKYAFSKAKETPVSEIKELTYFKLQDTIDKESLKRGHRYIIKRRHLLNKEVVKAVRTGDLSIVDKIYKEDLKHGKQV